MRQIAKYAQENAKSAKILRKSEKTLLFQRKRDGILLSSLIWWRMQESRKQLLGGPPAKIESINELFLVSAHARLAVRQ